VSRTETLRSLESVLTSFLDRAMALKEERLRVLGGINELDDIARGFVEGDDLTDRIGSWFAEHNRWLDDDSLKAADHHRLSRIFGEVKREIRAAEESSPAAKKISKEIDRWTETASHRRLLLKRGPESAEAEAGDTIERFNNVLERATSLFADLRTSQKHLLSVLDQALKTASLQKNAEALLLSALIIYYLKQNSYKIGPYISRLKEAEGLHRGGE
jgi:hypothetical protein